ncbi:MAG: MerR family transcriptional regulator [Bacteroidia bacterium]
MDRFSISQLQQFSGIKSHTIRIWEQRYKALTPSRSKGNTRFYDNGQLRRLLNIVSLMNTDYKLSELCTMPDEKLFTILRELQLKNLSPDSQSEFYISQLIAAGLSFDEEYFKTILSGVIENAGIKEAYIHVIYPMIERVGLMWANNSIPPAQEHFMSNLIRQKFSAATEALPAPTKKETWVLFLHENEYHEIGLLLSNYLIKEAGMKVIYLGANVPTETVINTVDYLSVDNLLFFLVHHDIPSDIQNFISELSKQFYKQKLFLSGDEKLIEQLIMPVNFSWLKNVDQLVNFLKEPNNNIN